MPLYVMQNELTCNK